MLIYLYMVVVAQLYWLTLVNFNFVLFIPFLFILFLTSFLSFYIYFMYWIFCSSRFYSVHTFPGFYKYPSQTSISI